MTPEQIEAKRLWDLAISERKWIQMRHKDEMKAAELKCEKLRDAFLAAIDEDWLDATPPAIIR